MKKDILKQLKNNFIIYTENNKKTLNLKNSIKNIKKLYLNKKNFFIIIKKFEKDPNKIISKTIKFSKLFGKPLSQNKHGQKFVLVKPNTKLLKKKLKNKKIKLRYHQTNLGGAIHSDGPQLYSPPKYVIMACLNQAKQGGDSIIVSTNKIYRYLKRNNKKILNVLKDRFYFERRGFRFSNNNIFKKAIFENSYNNFRFRYLREYIEAGHNIKKSALSPKIINAMNTLDELLNKKKFQTKYRLNEGDIIILNNDYLAHGRSGFKLNNKGPQRSLLRIWIR